MAEPATGPTGLQVGEDRAWQEKFWTAQRVGWIAMTVFILAALLGVTGKGGPVASASARSGDASIDYPRITRWQSDEEISLRLPGSASGRVEVLLSPEFSRLFSIKSIVPEPSSSETTASGNAYRFDVAGGRSEQNITFNVTSGRPVFGQRIEARIGGSKPAQLRVTVLP